MCRLYQTHSDATLRRPASRESTRIAYLSALVAVSCRRCLTRYKGYVALGLRQRTMSYTTSKRAKQAVAIQPRSFYRRAPWRETSGLEQRT